jgi:hypothetical protein
LYPKEYFDLFLYLPPFPVLFSPFALLPLPVGACLWNCANALLLFFALSRLPLEKKERLFIEWFVLIELITALHGFQSNPLIAACMVLTFIFVKQDRPALAALFPALAFFIKGYGVVAAALLFFNPRWRKGLLCLFGWLFVISVLPLPFSGASSLAALYREWLSVMAADHVGARGVSVISAFHALLPGGISAIHVQAVAGFLITVTLLAALISGRGGASAAPLLSYLMIAAVIFNHNAESPTYVIAVVGAALWYAGEAPSPLYRTLMVLLFFLTVLAPTDLYPRFLRVHFFEVFSIKAIPCFLVWIALQVKLARLYFTPDPRPQPQGTA